MSSRLDEKVLAEIADELDIGMECFYHIPTGTFEYHPDTDHPDFDPQWWQEPLDKIAADRQNYFQIEGMQSRESFQVMENFAEAQADSRFKNILIERLKWRKPFRNFMEAIHESDYRQDWFDFKKKVYMDWVREQIEERFAEIRHFQDKMNSGEAMPMFQAIQPQQTVRDTEPTSAEDLYRKRLISAYQNLLNFKNELFTDALNLAMAGDLKEVDAAFEEGDSFTFTIEHLEGSDDINLQKLVELVKQLDVVMGTLSNINAIQEDELE